MKEYDKVRVINWKDKQWLKDIEYMMRDEAGSVYNTRCKSDHLDIIASEIFENRKKVLWFYDLEYGRVYFMGKTGFHTMTYFTNKREYLKRDNFPKFTDMRMSMVERADGFTVHMMFIKDTYEELLLEFIFDTDNEENIEINTVYIPYDKGIQLGNVINNMVHDLRWE